MGYASSDESLENHVMQIRTGEGKSIALGGGAALLALLGFRVRCVCYSEYLSQRDYKAFSVLFEALNVEDSVTYSTIGQYSNLAPNTAILCCPHLGCWVICLPHRNIAKGIFELTSWHVAKSPR